MAHPLPLINHGIPALEQAFNDRVVRFLVIILVLVPVTFGALFLGVYGVSLGMLGFRNTNPPLALTGLLTVAGLVGILGAWTRLLVPTERMDTPCRRRVRLLLGCGVCAALGLVLWAWQLEATVLAAAPLLLVICGVLLLLATPSKLSD